MGQITDIYKSHDSSNKICKVVFTIDDSKAYGMLRFTHEICVGYDFRTRKWSGNEINADGWVTLYPDEIDNVVAKYCLNDKLKEVTKNGE